MDLGEGSIYSGRTKQSGGASVEVGREGGRVGRDAHRCNCFIPTSTPQMAFAHLSRQMTTVGVKALC